MSTRGASGLTLQRPWQMMGALEAVNGMLLFGISTAYVFAVMPGVLVNARQVCDLQPRLTRIDRQAAANDVSDCAGIRRSSAAVATSQEEHRSPKSDLEVLRRRWGRGLPGIPASMRP